VNLAGNNPEGQLLHDALDGTTLADGFDNFVTDLQLTDFADPDSTIPAQPNRGLFSVSTIDIDLSGGPFDGRIYMTYSDRSDVNSDDVDIFLRFSDDGGATWSNAAVLGEIGLLQHYEQDIVSDESAILHWVWTNREVGETETTLRVQTTKTRRLRRLLRRVIHRHRRFEKIGERNRKPLPELPKHECLDLTANSIHSPNP